MKHPTRQHPLLILIVILIVMALSQSCSVKKNRAASRNYHGFVTRYNVLYNGESKYREAVDELIELGENDSSAVVMPHPADVVGQPRPAGFEYSIEKAQKAIGLHSISGRPRGKAGHRHDPVYRQWMSRKEYNPVMDKAWRLLGNSYYMSGRYDKALRIYEAAERRFAHDKTMVDFCRIMRARCCADMGWNFEASMWLNRINVNGLNNKELKYLYYTTLSLIESNNSEFTRAAETALKGLTFAPSKKLAMRLKLRANQLKAYQLKNAEMMSESIDNEEDLDDSEYTKYREAYHAYLENRPERVHQLADSLLDVIDGGELVPKLLFVDAMAYATQKDKEKFSSRLSRLVNEFPGADVAPLASDYLEGLRQGRRLVGSLYVADSRDEVDEMPDGITSSGIEFTFDVDTTHCVVVSFDVNRVNSNKLLFDVNLFNFSTFDTRDFDVNRAGQFLSIMTFDNYDDAMSYIKRFVDSNRELMNEIRMTPMSFGDFELLRANDLTVDDYITARADAFVITEKE